MKLLLIIAWTLINWPNVSQAAPATGWSVTQDKPQPQFPDGCLPVLPMADVTRAAGVEPVVHKPDDRGHPDFEPKAPPNVLKVKPGVPTTLPGMSHTGGLIAAWSVELGLGLNAETPPWVGKNALEKLEVRAPANLSGAVIQVAGKDEKGEWVLKHLAVGDAALRNLAAFEHHYLRLRRANLTWPYGEQPPAVLAAVEPTVAALIRFDLDGDGGDVLLGFTVTRFLDAQGDAMVETGELGVVWSRAGKTAGTVGFALDQGMIFPRFEIAPTTLNDGRRLLFSAIRCCDGVSIRAFHLEGHRFEAVPPILRSGPYAACLRPGGGPGTPFVLDRVE